MNFDREFKKVVDATMTEVAKETDRTLNSVAKSHGGKPVSQVTPALRSKLRAKGWKLSESELKEYAEAISKGHNFKVRRGK